jgi:hypothetical protein
MRSISHAGDGVGQELSDGDGPARLGGEAGGRVVLDRGARGRDELFDGDLERVGRAVQHRERRVGGAGLEVRPRGARHFGELGDLLLGQPARLPQLRDVRGPSIGKVVGHAAAIA